MFINTQYQKNSFNFARILSDLDINYYLVFIAYFYNTINR